MKRTLISTVQLVLLGSQFMDALSRMLFSALALME